MFLIIYKRGRRGEAKKLRAFEAFAGIGAQAAAVSRTNLNYEIVGDSMPLIYPRGMGRSPQYWCGYVLAYYQWYTGLSFEQIGNKLPPSRIIAMYNPLHEASLNKFVEVANDIVFQKETNLASYRKNANMSQAQLSRFSKVSLRSIQLYEQRQLDINMAPAIKLFQLARALGCNIEDLLETNKR